MKKGLLALVGAMFLTLGAYADESFRGTVDRVVCPRLDVPVNDVCIVFATEDSGEKTAVVFNQDDFRGEFSTYTWLAGRRVNVWGDDLTRIYDYETIRVLKEYDAKYFYLMSNGTGSEIRVIKK